MINLKYMREERDWGGRRRPQTPAKHLAIDQVSFLDQ